jgi:DNA-binding IclR family transcriptional regulator
MGRLMTTARRQGFLVTAGFIHPDATAVSVPVIGTWRTPVAGLGAVVPSSGTDLEQVVSDLRMAATRTSERLAGSLTRARI